LRRWMRVFFSSLRCFFLAIRLRRFLMTEPIVKPHRCPQGRAQLVGVHPAGAPDVTSSLLGESERTCRGEC
jgi:hypothetical protein